jgi:hypothetical protein
VSNDSLISIMRSKDAGRRVFFSNPVATLGSKVSVYSSHFLPLVQMKPSPCSPANFAMNGPAAAM